MSDDATPAKVRLTDGLGALVARLQACADDPIWADHAEVQKALCAAASKALEEANDLAGHYMAQRDEERKRMALAVQALGIAGQCIHAAANDQWASFDALSDDFDDALAAVAEAGSPNDGLGQALEEAAYDCMSALAGVETCDVNLRDHPEAWAAIEAFAAKVRAAERERYDELFAAYNEVCAISSRRAAAVDAIVSHWREFGPEHGLGEVIEQAAVVVGRA